MEKIKVGEYIRTKNGTIAKIEDVEFDLCFSMTDGKLKYKKLEEDYLGNYITVDEILNHSFDIMDLIEVGDVLKLKAEAENFVFCVGIVEESDSMTQQELINEIKNGEVKLLSIVTKEQFNSVEYEV